MPIDERYVPKNAFSPLPGVLEWRSPDKICCLVENWRAITEASFDLVSVNKDLARRGEPTCETIQDYFINVLAPAYGGTSSYLWQQEMENNWDAVPEGLAAFYNFDFQLHTSHYMPVLPNCMVHVMIDYGWHHPCVTIAQSETYDGPQAYHFHEVWRGRDIDLKSFVIEIINHLKKAYIGCEVIWYETQEGKISNAGGLVTDTGARSPHQVLVDLGIIPKRPQYMKIDKRVDLINYLLTKVHKGKPIWNFNPGCPDLIECVNGGYTRAEIERHGQTVPTTTYIKDGKNDHVADDLGALAAANFVNEKDLTKKFVPRHGRFLSYQ